MVAMRVALTRSEEIPLATLPMVDAVAGATITRSAQRASSVCGDTRDSPKSEVIGFSPVMAAKVWGPMNSRDDSVISTLTLAPASTSRRARYADL